MWPFLCLQSSSPHSSSRGEKLLSPTPGARNLLKHMVKEDTDKKVAAGAIRSVTAKELLAMTHQSMLARRKLVGRHHVLFELCY